MVAAHVQRSEARRPLAVLENSLPRAENIEKPAIFPQVARSSLAELQERERALDLREQNAADVSRGQEERQQDLEVLEMRLIEREEVLKEHEAAQSGLKDDQDSRIEDLEAKLAEMKAAQSAEASKARVEGEQALAAAEQRISERAGRLAAREKRVADDEAAVLKRERAVQEREERLEARESGVTEAESLAVRRRSEAEMREMQVAELESRVATALKSTTCNASGPSSAGYTVPFVPTEPICGPPIPSLRDPADGGLLCSSRLADQPAASTEGLQSPSDEAAAVQFTDAEGNSVAFKLNSAGGVDYYLNGQQQVSNVDCFTRGLTLHVAGTCEGKWSPSRKATVPKGQEEVLQRVMALFQRGSRAPHVSGDDAMQQPSSASSSRASGSGDIGPGEELTLIFPRSRAGDEAHLRQAHHANSADKPNSKVVRFEEPLPKGNLRQILAPPASWEEELPPRSLASTFKAASDVPSSEVSKTGQDESQHQDAAGRRRLTARKRAAGTGVPATPDEQELQANPESFRSPASQGADGGFGFTRLAAAVRRRVSMSG